MTPVKMMVERDMPLLRDNDTTNDTLIKLDTMANPAMNMFLAKNSWPSTMTEPVIPAPKRIAIAAPKDAADDNPNVKGLTNGLRRMFCITAPDIARLNPVIRQSMVRDNLALSIISGYQGVVGLSKKGGSIACRNTRTVSLNGISTAPILTDTTTATNERREAIAMNVLLRREDAT